MKQFHSSKFIYLNNKTSISNRSENADAIISEKKGLAIGVLTADCVPILIYDYKRKMIAAIHAGWRGAYKGIVHKVIKFMLNKGCNTKNMTASIGPCISSNHYEVKEPFQKRLIRKNKDNRKFFINKKNKLYFDLSNFVKKQVQLNKIKNVDMLNIDTFNKKNNFFSARRSLKLNQNDYGRNISLIMIN